MEQGTRWWRLCVFSWEERETEEGIEGAGQMGERGDGWNAKQRGIEGRNRRGKRGRKSGNAITEIERIE